jgi:hypothetical protein
LTTSQLSSELGLRFSSEISWALSKEYSGMSSSRSEELEETFFSLLLFFFEMVVSSRALFLFIAFLEVKSWPVHSQRCPTSAE